VDTIISESCPVSLSEELTMKKTRRTYTAEFKREAAAISLADANECELCFAATSAVADPNGVLPGVVLPLGEDSITGWVVTRGEPQEEIYERLARTRQQCLRREAQRQ
jgi:hypothetical protein